MTLQVTVQVLGALGVCAALAFVLCTSRKPRHRAPRRAGQTLRVLDIPFCLMGLPALVCRALERAGFSFASPAALQGATPGLRSSSRSEHGIFREDGAVSFHMAKTRNGPPQMWQRG
jgi:hypothetical protein